MHDLSTPISHTIEGVTVTVALTDAGQTCLVTVDQRTLHINELRRAFRDLRSAFCWAREICLDLQAGRTVAQIAEDRAARTAAVLDSLKLAVA